MVLLLTNIPFEDFDVITDKKQYANNCDFFDLEICSSKKSIIGQIEIRVGVYKCWNTNPLYVTIIKDNYWYKHNGNINAVSFTNWKTVPSTISESEDTTKFHRINIEDQIYTNKDVINLIADVTKFSFKNTPIFTKKVGF